MQQFLQKKVLIFGLLGGLGCLAGWLLGEGFLAAALSSKPGDAAATASLVSRPDAPKLDRSAPTPETPQLESGKAPPPLPPDLKKRVEEAGGKTGQIQITLIWFNRNDLDLHCIDPAGEEIYFSHKRSEASGGHLDVDRNVSGETEEPVENIYFPKGTARLGKYRVLLDYFGSHGSPDPTRYKANILVDDHRKDLSGDMRRGQSKIVLDEFELPGLRMAVPPEVVVYPGMKNKLPVRLERDPRNNEPVTLRFENAPSGVSLPFEVVIPGDRSDAEVEVSAAATASAGSTALRVVGLGKYGRAWTEGSIVVKERPPVSLIAAPPQVTVPAGGSNRMIVRIAREFFPGAATVRAVSSADGVRAPEVTVPAGKDEVEIEVAADSGASEGDRSLTIAVVGGPSGVEAPVRVTVTRKASAWSWSMIFVIGGWTALLAAGLSLALVIGQSRYMRRPWLSARQARTLLLGGALAGFVAGSIGQTLFGLLAQADVLPQIGFLFGWLLLGGLLGRGVVFLVPNLNVVRACAAGLAGGLLGALAFIIISRLGDFAGRLVGAGLLGFCIGLMVALVEVAFRKAWLEVRYSGGETIAVNLGSDPVRIGGDGKACTVWARGAAPVAMRLWVDAGKVLCEDVVAGRTDEISSSEIRQVGNLKLVVRTSTTDKSAGSPPKQVAQSASRPLEAKTGSPPPANPREVKVGSPPPPPANSREVKAGSPPPPAPPANPREVRAGSPPPPPPANPREVKAGSPPPPPAPPANPREVRAGSPPPPPAPPANPREVKAGSPPPPPAPPPPANPREMKAGSPPPPPAPQPAANPREVKAGSPPPPLVKPPPPAPRPNSSEVTSTSPDAKPKPDSPKPAKPGPPPPPAAGKPQPAPPPPPTRPGPSPPKPPPPKPGSEAEED